MDIEPQKIVTVRAVPVDLWRKLKSKAALDGDTLPKALVKALQQYVEAA